MGNIRAKELIKVYRAKNQRVRWEPRMIYSVERILEKWGNCWGRDRIGTEYPSTTNFLFLFYLPCVRLTFDFLTDDECLKIEEQIMNLHEDSLLQYQILMALYVQQANERDICTALHIPLLVCIVSVLRA